MGATELLALFQLITTYGPALEAGISGIFTKLESGSTVTLADVETEFAGVQPYGSYDVRLAGASASAAATGPLSPASASPAPAADVEVTSGSAPAAVADQPGEVTSGGS